uniref:Uncharacterized protein n=1 Tax=Onchocerca volvulus TaxID=6282 RepID=A0A8R1XXD7_ONCVO
MTTYLKKISEGTCCHGIFQKQVPLTQTPRPQVLSPQDSQPLVLPTKISQTQSMPLKTPPSGFVWPNKIWKIASAERDSQKFFEEKQILWMVLILFTLCYFPVHLYNLASTFNDDPFMSLYKYDTVLALRKFIPKFMKYSSCCVIQYFIIF